MKKIIITILIALFTVLSSNCIYAEEYTFTGIHADDEFYTYKKLEAAINYVSNPKIDTPIRHIAEIILTSNVDLQTLDTLVIPSGTSIEIDLNGYNFTNLSLKGDQPLFTNEGVLVIKDTKNGEGVVSIGGTAPVVLNKGIFDLESGTLKNENNTVIVNGADNLTKSAEVYINGGLITTQKNYAIIQHGFSSQYDSSIRINGGKFESSEYIIKTEKIDNNYKTSLYVDGGEFSKALNVTSTNCVRNASFNEKPNDLLCADNFYIAQDDDKFVVKTDYVARIGDTYYQMLTDAFKEAKAGDTITLLKDFVDRNSFHLQEDINFDLNGQNVEVNNFLSLGNYFDSSEIINDEQQYYCRPQGSIKISAGVQSVGKMIENVFSEVTNGGRTSNKKNAFPVFINGAYKFYTLTDYVVDTKNPENGYEAIFRFAPVIGFRGNSVWKEILLPSSSSNIKIGFFMIMNSASGTHYTGFGSGKGVNYDVSGNNSLKNNYVIFNDNLTEEFAKYNGMGRFIVNINYAYPDKPIFKLYPLIYDAKNIVRRDSAQFATAKVAADSRAQGE